MSTENARFGPQDAAMSSKMGFGRNGSAPEFGFACPMTIGNSQQNGPRADGKQLGWRFLSSSVLT